MRTQFSTFAVTAVFILLTWLPAGAQLLPQVTEKPKKPAAKPARIVVETSPNAQVYLDDTFKGQASPQGRLVMENVEAGPHALRVSLAGKNNFQQKITASAAKELRITAALADLRPRGGQVREDSEAGKRADAQHHSQLGDDLADQGDYDEAMAEYHKALLLTPKDSDLRTRIGSLFERKGDLVGAELQYREAIQISPDNAEAHFELGVILWQKKDFGGAISEYREAVKLKPDDPEKHKALGGVLYATGAKVEALEEFRQAYALNPLDAIARAAYEGTLKELGK